MMIGRSRSRAPSMIAERRSSAAPAVLIDQIDQHDRIGHYDSDQHQQTDHGRDSKRSVGDQQSGNRSGGSERDGDHQDQRLHQAAECPDHDHEDQCDRHQHRQAQLVERLPLVSAAPPNVAVTPGGRSVMASSLL